MKVVNTELLIIFSRAFLLVDLSHTSQSTNLKIDCFKVEWTNLYQNVCKHVEIATNCKLYTYFKVSQSVSIFVNDDFACHSLDGWVDDIVGDSDSIIWCITLFQGFIDSISPQENCNISQSKKNIEAFLLSTHQNFPRFDFKIYLSLGNAAKSSSL